MKKTCFLFVLAVLALLAFVLPHSLVGVDAAIFGIDDAILAALISGAASLGSTAVSGANKPKGAVGGAGGGNGTLQPVPYQLPNLSQQDVQTLMAMLYGQGKQTAGARGTAPTQGAGVPGMPWFT